MGSEVLLIFLGVIFVSQANKIPEKLCSLEEEVAISRDISLASSGEIDDLPPDVKFSIAKLVRELLDRLKGILEKLLDFASKQFQAALAKADGVIRRIEELAKSKIQGLADALEIQVQKFIDQAEQRGMNISECVTPKVEIFENSIAQLLQALNAEITTALQEEAARMEASLSKIRQTIDKIEINPCEGSLLDEFTCWTSQLTKVSNALLHIPTQVSRQITNTLVDMGNLSLKVVASAHQTVKEAEKLGQFTVDDIQKCILSVK
ncbi:unnamed protein product [Acanthoscelides obtectus]|uniref:Uncharacterized protein n=1 Tax=Acanthoscelides obtectus TaxID=200917 RepID=A0A9P0KLJ3_ACAOB|nr:unnamed protein product [Acanthoscelides obtectus]CAK1660512.1 hypothetical protein AOBTE_LOCUS22125 [Acanthoscelides obtectus]